MSVVLSLYKEKLEKYFKNLEYGKINVRNYSSGLT